MNDRLIKRTVIESEEDLLKLMGEASSTVEKWTPRKIDALNLNTMIKESIDAV